MSKIYLRSIATVNDIDDIRIPVYWIFDSEDPVWYKIEFLAADDNGDNGEVVTWEMGRELFRTALDENKIGGRGDVIVTPPINGEIGVLLRNNGRSLLFSFNEAAVRQFHQNTHKRVSADDEMQITMDKSFSKVK